MDPILFLCKNILLQFLKNKFKLFAFKKLYIDANFLVSAKNGKVRLLKLCVIFSYNYKTLKPIIAWQTPELHVHVVW